MNNKEKTTLCTVEGRNHDNNNNNNNNNSEHNPQDGCISSPESDGCGITTTSSAHSFGTTTPTSGLVSGGQHQHQQQQHRRTCQPESAKPATSHNNSHHRSLRRRSFLIVLWFMAVLFLTLRNVATTVVSDEVSVASQQFSTMTASASAAVNRNVPGTTVATATTTAARGGNRRPKESESIQHNNKKQNWTVFYNVFIPTDQGEEGIERAVSIIQEQLQQIGSSYARRTGSVHIYYNTIGLDYLNHTQVHKEWCFASHGLHCHHLQHYPTAFEVVTLTALQEYCQEHVDDTVIYLHTKGSYHDSDGLNTEWRRSLTAAAVSQQCLSRPLECNLCGLLFFPAWGMFIAGNMWTASCSYVQHLLSPRNYRAAIDRFVATQVNVRPSETQLQLHFSAKRPIFQRTLWKRRDRLCDGRFADECWIASHPNVNPCDVSNTSDIHAWMTGNLSRNHFEFSMAPRRTVTGSDIHGMERLRRKVLLHESQYHLQERLREYFWLAGNIAKWLEFYGTVPSNTSWVWKWFPDGALWWQGYQQLGKDVVKFLTALNGTQTAAAFVMTASAKAVSETDAASSTVAMG